MKYGKYLGVHNREDNERKEILDTEDGDGEDVLHDGSGPDLNTHGVAGPGQVHILNGLEHEDGRGDDEGDKPDGDIDQADLGVAELAGETIADLGDTEPPVNGNGGDGAGAHQNVGPLHGRHQLARDQSKVPLAPIQTLNQSWRNTDDGGGDSRDSKIENVDILWCPVHLLTYK